MLLRQGDIVLKKIEKIPGGAKRISNILKIKGETAGHEHILPASVFQVRNSQEGNRIFVKVASLSSMNHPEHPKLLVPPGNYEVIQAREHNNPDPPD